MSLQSRAGVPDLWLAASRFKELLADSRWWLRTGLVVGSLCAMVLLLAQGQLPLLAMLVCGGWALWLAYTHPMPALLVLLVFSTDVFAFRSVDSMPFLQVAAGLRLNLRDMLLIGLFATSILKLRSTQRRPPFLTPLALLAATLAVVVALGLLGGVADHSIALNQLRTFFTYAVYFIYVANIDSRTGLRRFLLLIFLVAAVSIPIELYELQFGFIVTEGAVRQTDEVIIVGSEAINYIQNRAAPYLFLTTFMAIGCVLEGTQVRRYAALGAIGLLGFAFGLERGWMVYLMAGIVAMALLQWRGAWRLGLLVAVASLVALLIAWLVPPENSSFHLWADRQSSILEYQDQSTYLVRVDIWQLQLSRFLDSPLIGFALGPRYLTYFSLDTGAGNTLVGLGLFGLAAVVALIGWMLTRGIRLATIMPHSTYRGYALGLVGTVVGMVAAYAFSIDFFTSPYRIWIPPLVMAMMDRMESLTPRA